MQLRSRDYLRKLMAVQRNGRGWSSADLALNAGLSPQLIRFLTTDGESARSSCSPASAEAICKALGVEIPQLFDVHEPSPATRQTVVRKSRSAKVAAA